MRPTTVCRLLLCWVLVTFMGAGRLAAQAPTLREAAAHYFSYTGYDNAPATTLALSPKGWLALTHTLDANGHRGVISGETLVWSAANGSYVLPQGDSTNGLALSTFLSSIDTFALKAYPYFGYMGWHTDAIKALKGQKSAPYITQRLAELYALRAQSHVWPLESYAPSHPYEKDLTANTIPATAWMAFVKDVDSALAQYALLKGGPVVLGLDQSPAEAAFCLAAHALLTVKASGNPALEPHFVKLAEQHFTPLNTLQITAKTMLGGLLPGQILLTSDPRLYYALWFTQQQSADNETKAIVYLPLLDQKRYVAYLRHSKAQLPGQLPLSVWQPANRTFSVVEGSNALRLADLCKGGNTSLFDSKGIVAPLSAKDLQVGILRSEPGYTITLHDVPYFNQKQIPLWFLALADIVSNATPKQIYWAESRNLLSHNIPNYLKDVALPATQLLAFGRNNEMPYLPTDLLEINKTLRDAEPKPLEATPAGTALQGLRIEALAQAVQMATIEGPATNADGLFALAGPQWPQFSEGLLQLALAAYELKNTRLGDSLTYVAINRLAPILNVFYATKSPVTIDIGQASTLLKRCRQLTAKPELQKQLDNLTQQTLANIPPAGWAITRFPQINGNDRLAIPHLGLPLLR